MTVPNTPTNSGTGANDAQSRILALLNAEDGATGTEDESDALQDDAIEGEEPEVDESEGEPEDDTDPEAGEAEEEDGEAEPDEEQEEADDAESNLPETIEIDGTPVPIEEVKKGYLRQSDYTRKTQALAEERNAFTAEAEAVREERTQYAQLLEPLAAMLQQGEQAEPDWDRLYSEDPANAARVEHLWRRKLQERNEKLQAIQTERQRLAEIAQREHLQTIQKAVVEGQSKLLEAFPTWKDPKIATAERKKIREYAMSIGYTEAELKLVTDPRAVIGLHKAMRFDELQKRRAQGTPPPKQTVRPMRPGAAVAKSGGQSKQAAVARQRLAKSGSVYDAASAIESLI